MRLLLMAVVLLNVRLAHAQDGAPAKPPPAEDVPPQEGEVPPQEGEAPPQEGDAPPQEGVVPSQEGEVPSQEGEVPSQEGEVPATPPAPPPAPAPAPGATPAPESAPRPAPAPTPEPAPPPEDELVEVVTPAGPAAEAQASTEPVGGEAPPPDCRKRWGCWDLLHSMKGTVLGVRGSLGYAWQRRDDSLAAGFMAIYLTEHFATHDYMTVHFSGLGALGRGTEGTEGGAAATLDFGFRARVSEVSGPFFRMGFQGLMLGHRALHVGTLEPLMGRAGYQYLKGDVLIEVGATQGFVPLARYGVGKGRLDLSRSSEVGGYAAVQFPPLQGNLSFMQVFPGSDIARDALSIGRFLLCSDELEVTLCADALYTRGRVESAGVKRAVAQGIYGGITIGLSP